MKQRLTIIEFVEKYTEKYSANTFLMEKLGDKWSNTTFKETREATHRIGAGLMALGLQKGEKVALLAELI